MLIKTNNIVNSMKVNLLISISSRLKNKIIVIIIIKTNFILVRSIYNHTNFGSTT